MWQIGAAMPKNRPRKICGVWSDRRLLCRNPLGGKISMKVVLNSRVTCALLIVFLLQLHISGCVQSTPNVANQHSSDQEAKQDYAQLRQQYEKTAAAGDAEAMNSLGFLYV